jgi:H+/Cl- antiporter ClcA
MSIRERFRSNSPMPTLVEMILFVGLAVLLAFAGMFLVRRSVRLSALEAHKEAAGFVYATLGVAHAVLLTFVVVAVWEQFHEAEATTDKE